MYKFCLNDAGRANSIRPKQKNDCTIRAIALATGLMYDAIYDSFKDNGRKCSRGTVKNLWQDYLNSQPFFHKISFPPEKGQSRMNLDKFCQEYNQGTYIVQMAGHLSTVINGVVHDTFQPRQFGCIYAAWKRI